MRIRVREPEKLRKIALHELSVKILPKVSFAVRDAIRLPVKQLLIQRIKATEIYQGIIGNVPSRDVNDIQAVMGLDKPEAENFNSLFDEIMARLIQVNRSSKFIAGIDVFISGNYKEVLGSQFSYVSEQSGTTIPWMDWLLNGIGEVDANIFFGKQRDFPADMSRSLRAIMTQVNGEPFDSSFNYNKGGDFIEKVFLDPSFTSSTIGIITRQFTIEMRKLR